MTQPKRKRPILWACAIVAAAGLLLFGGWLVVVRNTTLEMAQRQQFSPIANYVTAQELDKFSRDGCLELGADLNRYGRKTFSHIEMDLHVPANRFAEGLLFGGDYCKRYAAFRWAGDVCQGLIRNRQNGQQIETPPGFDDRTTCALPGMTP